MRRDVILLPDDLAAKLGCREVFEDELESRLKVAEEMIRSERSAGVFAFLLSQRENGLAKLFLSKLSSCDVAMLSRVSKACTAFFASYCLDVVSGEDQRRGEKEKRRERREVGRVSVDKAISIPH